MSARGGIARRAHVCRAPLRRATHRALLAAALYGAACATASAAVVSALVQEPRAFGYVLGDVLTQRVLLEANGRDVGAVTPPSVGRTGVWLERRPVTLETDANGRKWMVIAYQVVNAPQTLTQITLPALTLTSAAGTQLQVAEWPASIGPLTPQSAFATGDLQPLRPDRQVPVSGTAGLRQQIAWALGLLLATLIAWTSWWWARNRRESARLPFARAWRQMQRLPESPAASSSEAWVCLHRALNETAGQVVHATSLPALLARAPYLQPLRAQLERFYEVSSERFFRPAPNPAANGDKSADETSGEFPLHALCRALYRAERRHQR
ncbi:calcium incorporation protein MxaA [Paraburkholderia sp. MMS20-SJTN17]|uniref:Calcium incorporation protein MxaA n=1 Tax=Paraburkholderia translucens TaxID=2886945 RepID=A0ABS8KEC3_9BURK|nr:calcium incorporation protein MxaA [Paraburkholderia sp. MMS20-SJTN17]MCC8403119.1 calcium incorporation protein MxaA [Paraburkholderia sp. MMS20-SJTN17]